VVKRVPASDGLRAQTPQVSSTEGLNPMRKLILLGEIGRPHGVRGLVRLHAFTEDFAAIGAYGALTDATGAKRFVVTPLPGGIGRVEGVADRDAAARLTGTKLYVERDRLPASEGDDFFLCDLEGCTAFDESGATLGTVRSVEDYGAGPFLVIVDGARETLVPFTKAAVPVVDVAAARIVVVAPAELIAPAMPPPQPSPAKRGRAGVGASSAPPEPGSAP
jgi:16S rRNA processing protein RimM